MQDAHPRRERTLYVLGPQQTAKCSSTARWWCASHGWRAARHLAAWRRRSGIHAALYEAPCSSSSHQRGVCCPLGRHCVCAGIVLGDSPGVCRAQKPCSQHPFTAASEQLVRSEALSSTAQVPATLAGSAVTPCPGLATALSVHIQPLVDAGLCTLVGEPQTVFDFDFTNPPPAKGRGRRVAHVPRPALAVPYRCPSRTTTRAKQGHVIHKH